MRRTLVASSRKRRVASSLTMALSTWGWASRSKSETCQGAGRQAKLEAPPGGRRASVATTSTSSRHSKKAL